MDEEVGSAGMGKKRLKQAFEIVASARPCFAFIPSLVFSLVACFLYPTAVSFEFLLNVIIVYVVDC
jgi:hypothetical protein